MLHDGSALPMAAVMLGCGLAAMLVAGYTARLRSDIAAAVALEKR